ncbi:hypothetical protein [Fluviicola sp.]|uniref:hypothetical protein n=1 Tax=Fluviicola sp. TaxID=1917219 RepID=UPI002629EA60|nr:hypothetical protein [Fluviicola sp.]
MIEQHRINNPEKIDRSFIDTELKAGKRVIIQFSDRIYSDKILTELDTCCQEFDDNFIIRFYGHYQSSFDCKTLLKLPNAKAIHLDCLLKADNLEFLTELKNLSRLSLGVFELADTEIFRAPNFFKLKELTIGETKRKGINLKYLEDYKDLSFLIVCGHTKNLEVVGKITNLKFLGLNSVSKVSIAFINELKKLKSLHFVLGGRENINEIEENEIENLEIIRVRGFNNFTNVSKFKKLKSLRIEDQLQLTELRFEKDIPTLKELRIINCKTFSILVGLEKLTGLNELRIYKTDIRFAEFIKQPFSTSLDTFTFCTSKRKIDNEISNKLIELGYSNGLEK